MCSNYFIGWIYASESKKQCLLSSHCRIRQPFIQISKFGIWSCSSRPLAALTQKRSDGHSSCGGIRIGEGGHGAEDVRRPVAERHDGQAVQQERVKKSDTRPEKRQRQVIKNHENRLNNNAIARGKCGRKESTVFESIVRFVRSEETQGKLTDADF